jgi:hypothetical protein
MNNMLRVCISPIDPTIDNEYLSMLIECRSPIFFIRKYHNIVDILNHLQNKDVYNIRVYKNNVIIFHPSGIKILLEFEIIRENDKYCLKINSPITKNQDICKILGSNPSDKYVKITDINNFNIFYCYIKNIIRNLYYYEGFIPYDNNLEKTIDMVNSMIICEINRLTNILEDVEDITHNKIDINNQIDLWFSLKNWNGDKNYGHPGIDGVKHKINSNIDEITNKITSLTIDTNYFNNELTLNKIKMLNYEFNYWMFLIDSL